MIEFLNVVTLTVIHIHTVSAKVISKFSSMQFFVIIMSVERRFIHLFLIALKSVKSHKCCALRSEILLFQDLAKDSCGNFIENNFI